MHMLISNLQGAHCLDLIMNFCQDILIRFALRTEYYIASQYCQRAARHARYCAASTQGNRQIIGIWEWVSEFSQDGVLNIIGNLSEVLLSVN